MVCDDVALIGKIVSLTGPVGAPGPVKATDSAVVRLVLKQIVVQLPCPLLYAKQFTYGTAALGCRAPWPPG